MKKIFPIVAILALLAVAVFFRADLQDVYDRISGKFEELRNIALGSVEREIGAEVSAPPPLRSEENSPVSVLTKAGVIEETNKERSAIGRSALSENQLLNRAAKAKLEDMFRRQYFDHISPDGKGPADLAKDASYSYIAIGENLALGNFKDDQALVQAWMDSPGHRENILHPGFSEIGVAVGKGFFEGKIVWMAVQEFGRPESDCPKADSKLKKQIEENEKEISALKAELAEQKKEIENSDSLAKVRAKIEKYNDLVRRYNALAEETKNIIAKYNSQVKKYNACLVQP